MTDDRKFYEKNRNPVTGDRIVSKERTRDAYRNNFDGIKWGTLEKEESLLEPLSDKCRKEK